VSREQEVIARDCWAADISVSEAYTKIEQRTGSIMPLNYIAELYEQQDALFEQWLVMEARARKIATS
jgi:hypothetical protein